MVYNVNYMSLTVVIPTLNEASDLPRTLKSLSGLADEILIIDSGSTDDTVFLAEKAGAKVIHHFFKNFADTRNFGDNHASSDWILSIDADVVVTPEASKEIKRVIQDSKFSAYFVGRINIIWNKPILHADWGPKDDCHLRLYRRGSGNWKADVHETFITTRPVGRLKAPLKHYNYASVEEYIEKINHYSEMAALKTDYSSVLAPFKDFFKRYFYKLGFLEGYHGLFLCYLQAIYYTTLRVKIKEKAYV